MSGPLTVIALQLLVSFLTQRIPAFRAITLGTLISGLAWLILIAHPTVPMARAHSHRCLSGRDNPIASLLRIYFPARAAGPTGHVYGLCLPAHRDRFADRRLVRRCTGPSLRRSHAPTRAHLVGRDRGGRGYCRASVDLRQDAQTRIGCRDDARRKFLNRRGRSRIRSNRRRCLE